MRASDRSIGRRQTKIMWCEWATNSFLNQVQSLKPQACTSTDCRRIFRHMFYIAKCELFGCGNSFVSCSIHCSWPQQPPVTAKNMQNVWQILLAQLTPIIKQQMVNNDWNLSFESMKRLNRNFRPGDIGICLWRNKNFSQTRWQRPGARNCKQNSCQNQWRLPCYRCISSNAMFARDVANAVTNIAVVSNPYLHLFEQLRNVGIHFPQAAQTKQFPPSLGSTTREILSPLFHYCLGLFIKIIPQSSDHIKWLEYGHGFCSVVWSQPVMPVCQQNAFGQKQQCIPRISTNLGTNNFAFDGVLFLCRCYVFVGLMIVLLHVFVRHFVWPILSCLGVDGNCAVVGPQGCVCVCQSKILPIVDLFCRTWFPSGDDFWVSVFVWYLLSDKRQSLSLFTCLLACPSVLPPPRPSATPSFHSSVCLLQVSWFFLQKLSFCLRVSRTKIKTKRHLQRTRKNQKTNERELSKRTKRKMRTPINTKQREKGGESLRGRKRHLQE